MRIFIVCLMLLAGQAGAQKTSLSHSVNQARTQGKVLSAKTKNGQHIVKILTPDGRIKTIKKAAYSAGTKNMNAGKSTKNNRPNMDKRSRVNRNERNASMSKRLPSSRFESQKNTHIRNTNKGSKDGDGQKRN